MMATTAENMATALALAAQGLSIFPCQSGGERAKQPMPFIKWRDVSTADERQVRQWWQKWPDAAIGLDLAKCGLLVIDADRHGEHDGVEAFGQLMSEHGFDPDSAPLVATPNEGNHHFFRQPEGVPLGNGRGTLSAGIDVRGHGGYVVAPGSVMADGRVYELHGNLAEAPVLPDWLQGILTTRKGGTEQSGVPPHPQTDPIRHTADRAPDAEIEELLAHIPPDLGYHEWVSVLMAVHAETSGGGFALADAWSARGSKYPGVREMQKKWASFKRSGVTGRTLAETARLYGADLSAIASKHRGHASEHDPIEAADAAHRLIKHHDRVVIYDGTEEVEEPVASESLPAIEYPSGLVGDIAKWIVDTSRRPQPELAIGAALTIVGTAAGRQFAGPTRSGTHLYVLGLAPTGTGKDHPLQAIARIMAAARLGHHLGPSEFISMPAVVNFLMRKPLSVCPMDEFGAFMKRINSKRASGFEGAISKVIRTMWSSSFAPYPTPEWAGKPSEMIFSPSMSLFGASTPEQFYNSMEGASIEDGTLNRFLLIRGREQVSEVDPAQDASIVPEYLSASLKAIYDASGPLSTSYRNDPSTDAAAQGFLRPLAWCPDGTQRRYRDFSAQVEGLARRSEEMAPFYARTAEIALRIASIIAVGRMEDDQVRFGDLEFGIGLANSSADIMIRGASEYMAENEHQANAQRVLRIIRSRKGRIRHKELLVAMKHGMRARDLRDLLASMREAGQIETGMAKTNGRDAEEHWIV